MSFNWCQICEEHLNEEEVLAFDYVFTHLDIGVQLAIQMEAKQHLQRDWGTLILCKGCFFDIASLVAQRLNREADDETRPEERDNKE